jgi:hypothetical protein
MTNFDVVSDIVGYINESDCNVLTKFKGIGGPADNARIPLAIDQFPVPLESRRVTLDQ